MTWHSQKFLNRHKVCFMHYKTNNLTHFFDSWVIQYLLEKSKTKNFMRYLLCSKGKIVISLGKSCSRRKVQGYKINGRQKWIFCTVKMEQALHWKAMDVMHTYTYNLRIKCNSRAQQSPPSGVTIILPYNFYNCFTHVFALLKKKSSNTINCFVVFCNMFMHLTQKN